MIIEGESGRATGKKYHLWKCTKRWGEKDKAGQGGPTKSSDRERLPERLTHRAGSGTFPFPKKAMTGTMGGSGGSEGRLSIQ